jgi:hypothetical protein
MGRKSQHEFHGAPHRFDVMAMFISEYFGSRVQYIADVAGGQGMLSRLLNKRYNYDAEVIDPRGRRIKGVPGREEEFAPAMADYYDVVVGLHPDEATRALAEAARERPVLIVPCCNFWSEEKLGRDELVEAIEQFYRENSIAFDRIIFPFRGPKNIGILSSPGKRSTSAPEIDRILAFIRKKLDLD